MGMSCGMSMVKYILFIFNLLCALCGIAIVAIGIIYYLKITDLQPVFDDWNVAIIPIVFIVFGSIIFIIAFYGCCGAIKESHCMTVTYSTALMILLLAQVILAIIVFVYMGDIQEATSVTLKKLWAQRDQPLINKFWDFLQPTLSCCGLDGPVDYLLSVPASCCDKDAQLCTVINAFQSGCSKTFSQFIHDSGNIFGAVAIGVAGIELLGFIFACCLANNIRNQTRRYA